MLISIVVFFVSPPQVIAKGLGPVDVKYAFIVFFVMHIVEFVLQFNAMLL